MDYKEIVTYLNMGKIVKSQQCLYIKIECENCIYWKWLGEDSWTKGASTLEECINLQEKKEKWEIAFDCNLSSY